MIPLLLIPHPLWQGRAYADAARALRKAIFKSFGSGCLPMMPSWGLMHIYAWCAGIVSTMVITQSYLEATFNFPDESFWPTLFAAVTCKWGQTRSKCVRYPSSTEAVLHPFIKPMCVTKHSLWVSPVSISLLWITYPLSSLHNVTGLFDVEYRHMWQLAIVLAYMKVGTRQWLCPMICLILITSTHTPPPPTHVTGGR